MSIVEKLKETKDHLKDKLKGHHDKAEDVAQHASEAVHKEAAQGTSATEAKAKDLKERAKDLKDAVSAKVDGAKERFSKH